MPLEDGCEPFVSCLFRMQNERFWTHASTTLPVSIWKSVGAFLIVTMTGWGVRYFQLLRWGREGKCLARERVVPSQMPIGPGWEILSPPLRRYWDVYMQFLFIRFRNTNKICQASESRLRELTETEGVELSLFLDIFSVWSLYPKQKRGSAQHWPKCDVEIEKFVFQALQHLFLPSPPDFHWFCSPSPKLPGIRKQLINSLGCKSFLLLLPIGYQEGKNLKCWNFRCGRER